MPIPDDILLDEDYGPDQTDLDLRRKHIRARLKRARELETVEAMIARYKEYENV